MKWYREVKLCTEWNGSIKYSNKEDSWYHIKDWGFLLLWKTKTNDNIYSFLKRKGIFEYLLRYKSCASAVVRNWIAVPHHEGTNTLIVGVVSIATVVSRYQCRLMWKTWPLSTGAELNLGDRVLGEEEKNSFIVFPEKGGHSGSCPEKLCVPPWDLMRHFIAMIQGGDADNDEGVCRACTPLIYSQEIFLIGLPYWLNSKESACKAGEWGLIPGSWRSPAEGNGNLLQYSYLANPRDIWAWATKQQQILMSFSGSFKVASGGFLAAPSLISSCSNMLFETQGKSWKLESILYKQENGGQKGSRV